MSPRPKTGNARTGRLEMRLSEVEQRTLEYCCKVTGLTKAEVVRKGIQKVYDEVKK